MKMKEIHKKVYEYIKQRTESGYSPSIREICNDLNIASTSTVARYVNFLVEEGYLEKIEGRNRAVKLAGGCAIRIPVVSLFNSGEPVTAFENVSEYVYFMPKKKYENELFALKVKDSGMLGAGILEDDIVIIEKTGEVSNGEIAAVIVDNEEAIIRRFFKENGHYRLQTENDAMEPIMAEKCCIAGRVEGVIRYM